MVVEKPEKPVDPHVHRGWLDHTGIVGFEDDPLGVQFNANVAVRDQHASQITMRCPQRTFFVVAVT
jgi:hypothetical protein